MNGRICKETLVEDNGLRYPHQHYVRNDWLLKSYRCCTWKKMHVCMCTGETETDRYKMLDNTEIPVFLTFHGIEKSTDMNLYQKRITSSPNLPRLQLIRYH